MIRPQNIPTSVTRDPFPNSKKVYRGGELHPSVRVAMREISLSPTKVHVATGSQSAESRPNAPVTVYDTSGPFTDPSVDIDVRVGLPPLRRQWILDRNDVEELPAQSSAYGLDRLADTRLDTVRFPNLRKPLRAKGGACVTQLEYARRGIITPEMEYVATRENLGRERLSE